MCPSWYTSCHMSFLTAPWLAMLSWSWLLHFLTFVLCDTCMTCHVSFLTDTLLNICPSWLVALFETYLCKLLHFLICEYSPLFISIIPIIFYLTLFSFSWECRNRTWDYRHPLDCCAAPGVLGAQVWLGHPDGGQLRVRLGQSDGHPQVHQPQLLDPHHTVSLTSVNTNTAIRWHLGFVTNVTASLKGQRWVFTTRAEQCRGPSCFILYKRSILILWYFIAHPFY